MKKINISAILLALFLALAKAEILKVQPTVPEEAEDVDENVIDVDDTSSKRIKRYHMMGPREYHLEDLNSLPNFLHVAPVNRMPRAQYQNSDMKEFSQNPPHPNLLPHPRPYFNNIPNQRPMYYIVPRPVYQPVISPDIPYVYYYPQSPANHQNQSNLPLPIPMYLQPRPTPVIYTNRGYPSILPHNVASPQIVALPYGLPLLPQVQQHATHNTRVNNYHNNDNQSQNNFQTTTKKQQNQYPKRSYSSDVDNYTHRPRNNYYNSRKINRPYHVEPTQYHDESRIIHPHRPYHVEPTQNHGESSIRPIPPNRPYYVEPTQSQDESRIVPPFQHHQTRRFFNDFQHAEPPKSSLLKSDIPNLFSFVNTENVKESTAMKRSEAVNLASSGAKSSVILPGNELQPVIQALEGVKKTGKPREITCENKECVDRIIKEYLPALLGHPKDIKIRKVGSGVF